MDYLSSRLSKRRRVSSNINIPMIECKREFNLPHKYPSTVPSKYNFIPKNNGAVTITNTEAQNSFSESRAANIIPANNTKKLRIKTLDGRDLGEIKLEFLSKNNILHCQKITDHIKTAGHKTSNPINCSPMVSDKLNGPFNNRGSQNCKVTSQLIVRSIPSQELPAIINNKLPEIKTKSKDVLQKLYILAKINKMDANSKQQLFVLNQDGHKLLHNISSSKEIDNLEGTNRLIVEKKKPHNLIVKGRKVVINKNKLLANQNMKRVTKAHSGKQTNISSNEMLNGKYWQLVSSKFPVVRCEKLLISKPELDINNLPLSPTKINNRSSADSSIENNSQKDSSISNKIMQNIKLNDSENNNAHILITKIDSIEGRLDNVVDINNDTNDVAILHDKDITSVDERNCMPTATSNLIVHNENWNISNNAVGTPDVANTNVTHNSKNKIMNNGQKIEKETSSSNKTPITGNNIKEKDLSEYLDVIKKALTSVKDEELKTKALQALADCGIGIGKQVQVAPPEQLKTVHDSQVQTVVFGLIDKDNFVSVKDELSILQRIKQKQRTTINPHTSNAETQTRTVEKQTQNKIVCMDTIENVDLFPMWNSVAVENTLDLDNYFNEYFNDNRDVIKVRKALSTPHSLYKKVATQLQRDYESLQQYDENGMLNIHRAVVNDHLQEVERLLLVVKASNVNIDVLTENDMTALELAIKYDASVSIVKALLVAGANPILPKLLHESAVMLASKLSSPLLVHLLNYVTDSTLLNYIDPSGLAALHYCALNGNLGGVISLIEAGANVNLRDNRSGRCAVFHALENNHVLVAHKLLHNGANAYLHNFSGQSAINVIDIKNLWLRTGLKKISL